MSHQRQTTTGFALSFLIAASLNAPSVFAAGVYDEGLQYFNAGKFYHAAVAFGRAAAADPLNAMVHYYWANSLVKIGDHERAAREYRVAFLLEPQGIVSGYCRQALIGYKLAVPNPNDSAAFRQSMRDTAGGAADLREAPPRVAGASPVQAPADTNVDKACDAITRQLSHEKQKHQATRDSSVRMAMVRAQAQARRIDEDAEIAIQKLYEPIIYPGARVNPLLLNPELLKQRAEEIRNSAKDAKEQLFREAGEESTRYNKWNSTKEQALEEVAHNLRTQMQSKTPNGVQLLPEGTDLYVRYYGNSPGRPIPETRQAVVRIISAPSPPVSNTDQN